MQRLTRLAPKCNPTDSQHSTKLNIPNAQNLKKTKRMVVHKSLITNLKKYSMVNEIGAIL